jgi:lysophospholipase L1-like esterase
MIRRFAIACMTLVLGACAHDPWAGTDGMAAFRPNDVVVFQGDSITDGGRWREGSDFNHIMGQDYAYVIAGEVGLAHPERNVVFLNRGVGSSPLAGMISRWQTDVIALKPTMVSILIGINDTLEPVTPPAVFEQRYDALLTETEKALPGGRIVLGEPFALPVGRYEHSYATEFPKLKALQEAVMRLAARHHLPVVMYQDAFDEACTRAPADHWSWDGVHPTYAGHALMAHEWLKTVEKAWGK